MEPLTCRCFLSYQGTVLRVRVPLFASECMYSHVQDLSARLLEDSPNAWPTLFGLQATFGLAPDKRTDNSNRQIEKCKIAPAKEIEHQYKRIQMKAETEKEKEAPNRTAAATRWTSQPSARTPRSSASSGTDTKSILCQAIL